MKHALQHYQKKYISNTSFPPLVSVVLKDGIVDYSVLGVLLFFCFLLEHQCDVVYQLCVLYLGDDDRTLTTEIPGLFQLLWSFHHPLFEFCSELG